MAILEIEVTGLTSRGLTGIEHYPALLEGGQKFWTSKLHRSLWVGPRDLCFGEATVGPSEPPLLKQQLHGLSLLPKSWCLGLSDHTKA